MPKGQEPQSPETPAQPDSPDSVVVVGAPGQDTPPEPAPAAPELVDYKVGEKTIKVSRESLEVLTERERDYDRRLTRQAEDLRKRYEQPPAPKSTQQPAEDPDSYYETAIFERPREAVKRIKEELKNEVRAEYFQEKAQDQFWSGFYRANSDLSREDDQFIVDAVMRRNWAELSGLPTRDAQKKLGDLTRSEILRLSQRMRETDEPTRAVVEPAASPRPRAPAPPADEGPEGITGVLMKRAKARAAARSKPASAA